MGINPALIDIFVDAEFESPLPLLPLSCPGYPSVAAVTVASATVQMAVVRKPEKHR
jgi:hypothetical protein